MSAAYSWKLMKDDEGSELVLFRNSVPIAIIGSTIDGESFGGDVFAPETFEWQGRPVSSWQSQQTLGLATVKKEALILAHFAWDGVPLSRRPCQPITWHSWQALSPMWYLGGYQITEFRASIARCQFESTLSDDHLRNHLDEEHGGLNIPADAKRSDLCDFHARDHSRPLHTHLNTDPRQTS